MCLCFIRRDLFRLAGAGLAAAACDALPAATRTVDEPGFAPRSPGEEPLRWIDVHCHVFNAADLPVLEFIVATRLKGVLGKVLLVPILAFVAAALKGGTPYPERELRELGESMPADYAALITATPGRFFAARPEALRDRFSAMALMPDGEPLPTDPDDILDGLLRVKEAAVAPVALPAPLPGSREFSAPLTTRLRRLESVAPRGAAPPVPEAVEFLHDALTEAGVRAVGATPQTPPTVAELSAFNAKVKAEPEESVVKRYLRWGLSYAKPRAEQIAMLKQLYGQDRVFLTPALVDYDQWLSARDVAPKAAQLGVMHVLGRKEIMLGRPLHVFAPFDPWRAVTDHLAGRDPLEVVKVAVRHGAVGVKLYPPMGFAAHGNALLFDSPLSTLPKPAGLFYAVGSQKPPGGTAAGVGAWLDWAMDSLLDWCVREQVAVMAHCAPTNTSRDAYKPLAGPAQWERALRRSPARRTLRLNLGHFGGIWDFAAVDALPADASAAERRQASEDQETARAWATACVELMREFPNVYADIGYFAQAMARGEAGTKAQEETNRFLAPLMALHQGLLRRRLMYGSDWSMMGREANAATYPRDAIRCLAPLFPGQAEDDLRWRNAARFLGLERGGGLRARLDALYRGLPAEAARGLAPFLPD